MKRIAILLAVGVTMFALFPASAQTSILDDFETDEGHFNLQPSFSGTTSGIDPTLSVADRNLTQFYSGLASQRLFIDDNGTNAPDGTAWRVRHLSGSGSPANNVSIAPDGYIGYAVRATSGVGLQFSVILDQGATAERGAYRTIVADGSWNLLQWNLDDANDWEAGPFGTGNNGAIEDGTNFTIDSLWFRSTVVSGDQDAEFFIDYIAFNNTGQIAPVPEPSTWALGLLGGFSLATMLTRSRRKQVAKDLK